MDSQNPPPDIIFAPNDTPPMVLRKMRRLLDWKIGENRTISSRLRKFGEETGEMVEALFDMDGVGLGCLEIAYQAVVDEIGDVGVLLQDILLIAAEEMAVDPISVNQAMAEKLEKKRLKWLEEYRNGK